MATRASGCTVMGRISARMALGSQISHWVPKRPVEPILGVRLVTGSLLGTPECWKRLLHSASRRVAGVLFLNFRRGWDAEVSAERCISACLVPGQTLDWICRWRAAGSQKLIGCSRRGKDGGREGSHFRRTRAACQEEELLTAYCARVLWC